MQLKSLDDMPIEPGAELAPEDAWLNDVGSSSQPPSKINPEQMPVIEQETTEQPSGLETYTLIDYLEFLTQQETSTVSRQTVPRTQTEPRIGPTHRLWPLLLRQSERIWQELHRKSGIVDVRTPALIEFVRNRSLDALHAGGELAGQIRDLGEAEQLSHNVVEEVLGYGPLEAFMGSEDVSDITVVGPHLAYVTRQGKVQEIPNCFEDERHLLRIIENMLRSAGRHCELDWPIADIRLPDRTSVSVVMPPYAVHGPAITIRKSSNKLLSLADLVQLGSMTQEMADFLTACLWARLNIVICGSAGSGRTTLLNALGSYIPTDQRIITIEHIAELQLGQKHVVALESRLTGGENSKRVTARDLVSHAIHMRPDHLIIGECRGSEVVELLQAMYSGFSGVMTSVYAHNLRNCLTRLEVMCLLGGLNLPITTMRSQIGEAMDVVVHISRLRDGSHKVMNIAEVQGVEDDVIRLQSIFHYQETEMDVATGKMQGIFKPGGIRPHSMPKFEAANIQLPIEMFVPMPALNGKR